MTSREDSRTPTWRPAVAALEVDYVAMHWRAHSTDMDARDTYADVVAEVASELASRVAALVAAGVDERRIILDPGLGFSKVGRKQLAALGTHGRLERWRTSARGRVAQEIPRRRHGESGD